MVSKKRFGVVAAVAGIGAAYCVGRLAESLRGLTKTNSASRTALTMFQMSAPFTVHKFRIPGGFFVWTEASHKTSGGFVPGAPLPSGVLYGAVLGLQENGDGVRFGFRRLYSEPWEEALLSWEQTNRLFSKRIDIIRRNHLGHDAAAYPRPKA